MKTLKCRWHLVNAGKLALLQPNIWSFPHLEKFLPTKFLSFAPAPNPHQRFKFPPTIPFIKRLKWNSIFACFDNVLVWFQMKTYMCAKTWKQSIQTYKNQAFSDLIYIFSENDSYTTISAGNDHLPGLMKIYFSQNQQSAECHNIFGWNDKQHFNECFGKAMSLSILIFWQLLCPQFCLKWSKLAQMPFSYFQQFSCYNPIKTSFLDIFIAPVPF